MEGEKKINNLKIYYYVQELRRFLPRRKLL